MCVCAHETERPRCESNENGCKGWKGVRGRKAENQKRNKEPKRKERVVSRKQKEKERQRENKGMRTGDGGCCGCGVENLSVSLQLRRSDASRRASYPFSSPERLTNHHLTVWSSALFSAAARKLLHHPLFYVAMYPQSGAESPVVSDRHQTTPHDTTPFVTTLYYCRR